MSMGVVAPREDLVAATSGPRPALSVTSTMTRSWAKKTSMTPAARRRRSQLNAMVGRTYLAAADRRQLLYERASASSPSARPAGGEYEASSVAQPGIMSGASDTGSHSNPRRPRPLYWLVASRRLELW